MPMKNLRSGISLVIVVLFLYSNSYSQDSLVTQPPTDSLPAAESVVASDTGSTLVNDTMEAVDTVVTADSLQTTETVVAPDNIGAADSAIVKDTMAATDTTAVIDTMVQQETVEKSDVPVEAPAQPDSVVAPATPQADIVTAPEVKTEKVLELEKDVVVGYGTMKKEDLTGSVVSVKSEEIARDAVSDIRHALQGKAAGVTVRQSGSPGKKPVVNIRGVGTINRSDPLYVVDGVPVNNIEYLNPNDIESISILKDASSTAIYGSRGANGVVMVTTKKAKEGTSSVTYDMSIGTQQMWKKPSLCNPEQWAILNNEAMRAANLPVHEELEDPSSLGEGTDWLDEILNKNPLVHQENVSVMRGTDKLKYFLSAGHFSQEGIIKGSDHRKVMLRFNTQNAVAGWFSLGNTFGISRAYTNYADESDEWNSVLVNALAADPVSKPRDEEGNLIPCTFNNQIKNPVGIIENTHCSTKKTVLSGTVFSNVDFFHLLDFKSTFGLDMAFNDSSAFEPKYYISSTDSRTNSVVTRKTATDRTWILENTLTYDTYLFDDHSLKLLAGTTLQDHELDSVMARNQDTPSGKSSVRYLDATSTSSTPKVGGTTVSNSLASVFGRLEYDYLDKYLLTATFRYDGSSRFGPDKRWGVFPSVAGAWKIANEPFMSDVTFIEGLKLRVGWGRIGNENIKDFQFYTLTSDGQDYPFGGVINSGTTYKSAGNKKIGWETQESTNAGLDISAFGGRIEFLGDFFIKKTIDMLLEVPIPFMAGIETPPMSNAGSLENRGVELVLNYRESVANVHSNIGINFTTYKNEVTNLGGNDAVIMDAAFKNAGFITRTEVGHPIGCFYGYKTDGLFQNWDEVNAHSYVDKDGDKQLVQPDAAPGDIRYRDDDHDGEWDKGYIGSPHPDFIVGLNADVTYRGFDLKVGLQGVYGNEIFNGTRWYTENGTATSNLDPKMLDRWTGEGSTNDVNYPRMNNKDANNIFISDRYIEDGSYLRLKTVQLGYNFDESFLRKFRIKKCRLYIGVENLLTLTRYSGLEPEVGLSEERGNTKNSSLTLGVDRVTYPQTRTYLVGLNLTL